jgi:hypothetical protein
MQPADVPVGQIEQKWELKMTIEDGQGHSDREHPVRTLPPVLAGIRAGKYGYPTFPCSTIASTVVVRDSLSPASCWEGRHLLTVAGAAHVRRSLRHRVSRLTALMDMNAGTKTPPLYVQQAWTEMAGWTIRYQKSTTTVAP